MNCHGAVTILTYTSAMWLTVHCVIAIAFGWWLIWLGERDLRAAGIAGLLAALAFTVAFNNWMRYRRAGSVGKLWPHL
jgi:hypothetical protein